ncbi:MAG: biotin--[acetyl-CoA-carboxylase] ligase [Candidatus Paceibacterota bacterium]|jgi:BirA family biotin operon repressor/biotin-[acetyl-CoA-carboxylase] ligase
MQIEKFKTISSTNKKAKEMSSLGVAPWTVVVSEVQENGYGRKGEAWYSPLGGLYFSIILPRGNIEDLQTITILAAFIVAKVIKESFNVEPLIKLPNDVLLNGKKICGILTENVIGSDVKLSVIGIGIDTNIENFPIELKDIATSLKMELGHEVDNEKLLEKIITELKNQFKTISE